MNAETNSPTASATAKYPEHPGAKVGGTSQDAADNMAEHAPTLRDRLDELFDRVANMTADEGAEALGAEIWSVRPRFSELVRMGRIVDAGIRRENKSGMTATAWKRATFLPVQQPEFFK